MGKPQSGSRVGVAVCYTDRGSSCSGRPTPAFRNCSVPQGSLRMPYLRVMAAGATSSFLLLAATHSDALAPFGSRCPFVTTMVFHPTDLPLAGEESQLPNPIGRTPNSANVQKRLAECSLRAPRPSRGPLLRWLVKLHHCFGRPKDLESPPSASTKKHTSVSKFAVRACGTSAGFLPHLFLRGCRKVCCKDAAQEAWHRKVAVSCFLLASDVAATCCVTDF